MDLHTWSDFAAILTCIFVVVGYLKYEIGMYRKSRKLEDYLKREQPTKHSAVHLIRHVGLTEDEIVKISFRNKHVGRFTDTTPGLATTLVFGYVP
jgi:hypothetical protein